MSLLPFEKLHFNNPVEFENKNQTTRYSRLELCNNADLNFTISIVYALSDSEKSILQKKGLQR